MKKNNIVINVIGAGLAGVEAANFLASRGLIVNLYEGRPTLKTGAHSTDLFGELVCSNSLKSRKLTNACGLLKEEMRVLDSLTMKAAEHSEIKGGDSLNVDRNAFETFITNEIKKNKNIIIHNEEVKEFKDGINIICTGPLTSRDLLDQISSITKEKIYSFFDASSPIIDKDSIDMSKAYFGSRYEENDNETYLNCPLNKEEYDIFYKELTNAERALTHDFDTDYFEGCLPIEVIASRGYDTLLFGPMKPVGLKDKEGNLAYAVVQLRQDDLVGDLYNMVGFQTNLKYAEQKRVFSLIPALNSAKFVRYGLMHRNSYVFSPKILDDEMRLKLDHNIYIAGQLSGVEGYVESAASGLLAGYYCYMNIMEIPHKSLGFYSVLGSLVRYITHTGINNFSPMNANFGIIYKAKNDSKDNIIARALNDIKSFKDQINE